MDFKEMFERADINSITRFVLNDGIGMVGNSEEDYFNRVMNAMKQMSEYITEHFDSDEADEIYERAIRLLEVCREVYFEVEMKVGAKLGYQLHFNADEDNMELPI